MGVSLSLARLDNLNNVSHGGGGYKKLTHKNIFQKIHELILGEGKKSQAISELGKLATNLHLAHTAKNPEDQKENIKEALSALNSLKDLCKPETMQSIYRFLDCELDSKIENSSQSWPVIFFSSTNDPIHISNDRLYIHMAIEKIAPSFCLEDKAKMASYVISQFDKMKAGNGQNLLDQLDVNFVYQNDGPTSQVIFFANSKSPVTCSDQDIVSYFHVLKLSTIEIEGRDFFENYVEITKDYVVEHYQDFYNHNITTGNDTEREDFLSKYPTDKKFLDYIKNTKMVGADDSWLRIDFFVSHNKNAQEIFREAKCDVSFSDLAMGTSVDFSEDFMLRIQLRTLINETLTSLSNTKSESESFTQITFL